MPIRPAATVGLAPSLSPVASSTASHLQRPLDKLTTAAERGRAIVLSEGEKPVPVRRAGLDVSI